MRKGNKKTVGRLSRLERREEFSSASLTWSRESIRNNKIVMWEKGIKKLFLNSKFKISDVWTWINDVVLFKWHPLRGVSFYYSHVTILWCYQKLCTVHTSIILGFYLFIYCSDFYIPYWIYMGKLYLPILIPKWHMVLNVVNILKLFQVLLGIKNKIS